MDLIKPLMELLSICVGCCCTPSSNISVQGKSYRIVKLLGEGGFSFVYLVQDSSGNQYAMKKIRCTLGSEEADIAQREVDAYQLFSHKNIIRLIDSITITESDGSKTIYIFLPYFKRGNLQDAINKNNMNKTHFSETDLLRQFRDVCSAVEYMHTFKAKGGARQYYGANPMLPNDKEALLDGQHDQLAGQNSAVKGDKGDIVPWAHRDIKPGNVLISDDGETPILMDFGSAEPARIHINSRQEALSQQDLAAEKCTMPYRAPELFDVKVNTTLDEKVDIWSLGCTLYAMAYGQSPFEVDLNQGGSVALAVLNNQYKFPSQSEDHYSDHVRKLIQFMLVTDPVKRPDINTVINKVNDALKQSSK